MNAGVDLDVIENMDLDAIAQSFRPTRFGMKDNVITIFSKGKPEYYEVFDEGLFKAFTAMDKQTTPTAMKLLSFPSKMLRAGAVLNPDFMVRNPCKR